jgi:Ser-tRNA(Ala) deacylase AlaX
VEYKGVMESPEKAVGEINEQIGLILASKVGSVNRLYSWEEAVQQKVIPETFKTAYVRVVEFAESFCPCGGTHVENVGEIEQLAVLKVQKKGKNVRVHYKVV